MSDLYSCGVRTSMMIAPFAARSAKSGAGVDENNFLIKLNINKFDINNGIIIF